MRRFIICILLTMGAGCGAAPDEYPAEPSTTRYAPAPLAASPRPVSGADVGGRPIPSAAPSRMPVAVTDSGYSCAMVSETVHLRTRDIDLPAEGRFVVEAHYATSSERFGKEGAPFPDSVSQEIKRHLRSSCGALRSIFGFELSDDCREIYSTVEQRRWTPSEGGGEYGQGARGELKPSLVQELWQGNLNYASIRDAPEPGMKYLIQNPENGATVVASFGFEIGPTKSKWIGGLTAEVHWALGTLNRNVPLWIGRAQDQDLPYGPVDCGKVQSATTP